MSYIHFKFTFIFLKLQLKLVTSTIFKGNKDSYPQSVPQPFLDTRISKSLKLNHNTFFILRIHNTCSAGDQEINPKVLQTIRNERIKVTKRSAGFSRQSRDSHLCVVSVCSTAFRWLNTTEMASNHDPGSSSSLRLQPIWSRNPKSNRDCRTRLLKVRTITNGYKLFSSSGEKVTGTSLQGFQSVTWQMGLLSCILAAKTPNKRWV